MQKMTALFQPNERPTSVEEEATSSAPTSVPTGVAVPTRDNAAEVLAVLTEPMNIVAGNTGMRMHVEVGDVKVTIESAGRR